MRPSEYLVQAYFQAFQDAAGEWRWRLRSANHRTIADSGEGYKGAGPDALACKGPRVAPKHRVSLGQRTRRG